MKTHKFLESCVIESEHLSLVVLDVNFAIRECNIGFAKLIRSSKVILTGSSLKNHLHPDSHHLLQADLPEKVMPIKFIFTPIDGGSVILNCRVNRIDDGYLLFGDQTIIAESDILKKMTILNNEMAALTRELNRKNRALVEAQQQIKTLTGIIPICMYCKEIRDDEGFWNQLEVFIENNSEAQFSHGICEKCMEEKFADQLAKRRAKEKSGKN